MIEKELTDLTRTERAHLLAQRYRKTATIRALRIDFPFTVATKEGPITGKAGDYLAIADDDSDESPHRWIIDAQTFAQTYVLADA